MAHRNNVRGRGRCNRKPTQRLLWRRQFAIVSVDHLRRGSRFQGDTVHILNFRDSIAEGRVAQCVLFPSDLGRPRRLLSRSKNQALLWGQMRPSPCSATANHFARFLEIGVSRREAVLALCAATSTIRADAPRRTNQAAEFPRPVYRQRLQGQCRVEGAPGNFKQRRQLCRREISTGAFFSVR